MSILWDPAEATVVEKVSLPIITTGTQNMGNGIYWLKAGTPLDEDYAVANDEDAVYIVAEDFFFVSTNPNQDRHVPLVKAGYVDINKAEASAGITFADAAKSALETAGIVLVDGLLEAGGGGGGGATAIHHEAVYSKDESVWVVENDTLIPSEFAAGNLVIIDFQANADPDLGYLANSAPVLNVCDIGGGAYYVDVDEYNAYASTGAFTTLMISTSE